MLHLVPELKASIGTMYRRDLVPPILHAVLPGGLPPTSCVQSNPLTFSNAFAALTYPTSSSYEKDVAAACIFLATKTEECGRKLRDIAKVYQSKVTASLMDQLSPEVCLGLNSWWRYPRIDTHDTIVRRLSDVRTRSSQRKKHY